MADEESKLTPGDICEAMGSLNVTMSYGGRCVDRGIPVEVFFRKPVDMKYCYSCKTYYRLSDFDEGELPKFYGKLLTHWFIMKPASPSREAEQYLNCPRCACDPTWGDNYMSEESENIVQFNGGPCKIKIKKLDRGYRTFYWKGQRGYSDNTDPRPGLVEY